MTGEIIKKKEQCSVCTEQVAKKGVEMSTESDLGIWVDAVTVASF